MPTGVALRDVREQLFEAAERILLTAGAQALTSRAVTAEAGCAKGVLHRHFADFDDFLVELVRDRTARIDRQAAALAESAGTGDIADRLAGVLTELFGSVALAVVGLVTFRDELRTRLRRDRPAGVPVLAEATGMVAGYLAAEQERGRIAADADTGILALTLIGAAHLLFAGTPDPPPALAAVHAVVRSVIGPVAPA